jgi:hypothetical protein
LTDDYAGFRGCYLHPRRPAIRNCINCERPICALCEEESGDVLLCLPCWEKLEAEEEAAAADPLKKAKFVPPPKRSAASIVGEVTIFTDGSVVVPEEEEPARPEPEEEQEPVAEEAAVETVAPSGADGPVVKRPLERKPLPTAKKFSHVPAKGPAARARREAGEPEPAMPARERVKIEKRPVRRPREPKVRTGPVVQLTYSIPYGVGAALVVAGAWLLFSMIAKQWSQISVFTIGIAVPWAFYKGSTIRKKNGERVWSTAPKPLWVAIPSVIVVAAITPAMEWFAFKLIYGTNPAALPFSDFMERYFKGLDWALVAFGLALAFLIPFMLKSGEAWGKPAGRKEITELEDAPQEEPDEPEKPEGHEAEKPETEAP